MRSSQSATADEYGPPDWLTARAFAHRGLHSGRQPENSRAAFEAAIEAGFGIELDVQASRDGQALVFHDYDLMRLTGVDGALKDWAAADLRNLALKGTDETIPTLSEALALIDGRAPVLIEIKSPDRNITASCQSVLDSLRSHKGTAGVMSFNPDVGHWFARHAPSVPRGLVVTEHGKKGFKGKLERRLSLWRARPHFLAYDIRDLPSRFAASARARGLPILTWTVRTPTDRETAKAHADQIIHELPQ